MAALRVVLVAEEGIGAAALKMLTGAGHEIVAVFTSKPASARPGTTPWYVARQLGLETFSAAQVHDPALASVLCDKHIDLLLNVHSLFVLPPRLLACARIGSFNLHPGPLPRYAGLNAPSWAIYRGERDYGVSVHWMEADIDTGDIAYQTTFPITETDTGFSLSVRCALEGRELLKQLIECASLDSALIPKRKQDRTQRKYFGRSIPNGGIIDWGTPAGQINDLVRAAYFYPFPSPWGVMKALFGRTVLNILEVTMTGRRRSAEPVGTIELMEGNPRLICVACKDQWLAIRRILSDGKALNAEVVLTKGERPLSGDFGVNAYT